MGVYFGETEITNIDNLVPQTGQDITQAFFGSTEVFTVWAEYDGILPAQYSANGDYLADYRIYGTSGGVGDETPNLFNAEIEQGSFDSSSGAGYSSPLRVRSKFEDDVIPAGTYTLDAAGAERVVVYVYDATKNFVIGQSVTTWQSLPFTFTINDAYYVRFAFSYVNNSTIVPTDVYNIMLTSGSTARASYVPYGYEIDINTKSKNKFNSSGEWRKPYSESAITASNTVVTITGTWYVYQAIDVTPNTDYYISFDILSYTVSYGCAIYGANADGTINNSDIISGRFQGSTTINSGGRTRIALLFYSGNSNAGTCVYDKILVELASEGTDFQPYSSTTTPIYIGDTPLGEDEYVSFKEQKVYRMVNGVLTPTDPPVPLPALPTVDGTNIVDYAGQSAAVPSRFYAKYRKQNF